MTTNKLTTIVVAACVLLLALASAYISGRMDGKKICTSNALTTYQEGVKKNAGIEKQTSRMAEPDLDRALSRWMR